MRGWWTYGGFAGGLLLASTSWGRVLKDNPYHIYSIVRADKRFQDDKTWAKTAMRVLESKNLSKDGAVEPEIAQQVLDGVALAREKAKAGTLFQLRTGGLGIEEVVSNVAADLHMPKGKPTRELNPRVVFQGGIADRLKMFSKDRRRAVDQFLTHQRMIDVFLRDNSVSAFHKWFLEGVSAYWGMKPDAVQRANTGTKEDSFKYLRGLLGEGLQGLVWTLIDRFEPTTAHLLAKVFPDLVIDDVSGREILASASMADHGPLTSFVAGTFYAPALDDEIAGGRAWVELQKKGYTPGNGFFIVGDSKAIDAANQENLEKFLNTLSVHGSNMSRNEAERLLRMPLKGVVVELRDGTLFSPGAALSVEPDGRVKIVLLFDSEEAGAAEQSTPKGTVDPAQIVRVWGE